MTLPDERYNAVIRTREFLYDLIDPKKTPKIPKSIRQQAVWCLRHYPNVYEMDEVAQCSPHIFAEQMEPLYRMVKHHQQNTK